MKEYYSIPLEDKEGQFLEELPILAKESIEAFPFPGDVDSALKSPTKANITFWYEDNHIIGLYFFYLDLKNLPESIGNLSKLRFLFLQSCYSINSFPFTFQNLQCLEVFILVNNLDEAPLVNIDFPDVFKNLKNLNRFVIEGKFNIFFPHSFVKLESLEEIYLDSCFLSTTRTNFLLNFNVKNQYHIAQPVYNLPDDFGKLVSLKKLELFSLGVENLPESMRNLTSLTELNLSHCSEIKNIEIIFDIPSLEKLNLYYCEIKLLPNKIGKLTNLKILNLSHNKLQELPSEIKNCKQLEKIDLTWNWFEEELSILPELPLLRNITFDKAYPEIIPKELYDRKDLKVELV